MPKKEEFGAQPPIELMRQWIDYGYWFDRQKIVKNFMCNLQVVAAMGPPGGGRAELTPRMVSKFHVVNYVVAEHLAEVPVALPDLTEVLAEMDRSAVVSDGLGDATPTSG